MNRRSWILSTCLPFFYKNKKRNLKYWGVFTVSNEKGDIQSYSISKNPLEGLIDFYLLSTRIELIRGDKYPENCIRCLNPTKFLGKIYTAQYKDGLAVKEAREKLLSEIYSWNLQSGDVIDFYSTINPGQREYILRVL